MNTDRPYQSRAIAKVREAYAGGSRAVCLVAPCGAGKTHLAEMICRTAKVPVLFLVHRIELQEQAERRIPGVRVVTIQGLLSSGERPEAGIVIIDEAHHIVSQVWRTLADHYRASLIVGLTATPERSDGTPLGDIFDHMVVAAKYSELIAGGWLVPAELFAPDKKQKTLAMSPLEAVAQYADSRQSLIFSATVGEARSLGACVDGETPTEQRKEIISRFRRGDLPTLASVYVLGEGFDVPDAGVAVLARGFGHTSTYLQACGRVLRPSPGKTVGTVVDLVGSSLIHGTPDEDREYSLTGKAIRRSAKTAPLWQCKACGRCYPSSPPNRICPGCGHKIPEPQALVVARRQLRRKERDSMARPEEKAATYRALVARAQNMGYKPAWAAQCFRGKYGHWPS